MAASVTATSDKRRPVVRRARVTGSVRYSHPRRDSAMQSTQPDQPDPREGRDERFLPDDPEPPDDTDIYGPASFPASDPPSTWWGGKGSQAS
jgi:hypothetical protein